MTESIKSKTTRSEKATAGVAGAWAAALLVLFLMPSAGQQQSFAQYPDTGGAVGGVTEETLKRCEELGIPRPQCSDSTVIQKERVDSALEDGGSGTPLIATETGGMVLFIGLLGAIFGGVAAAFLVKGRGERQVAS